MRVMVLVKATKDSEAGVMPSTELLEAMGKYNEELVNAGILLAGEGLKPSALGKRVAFDGPSRTVIDGPFAETRELAAGFWLWEVKDMAEAQKVALRNVRRDINKQIDTQKKDGTLTEDQAEAAKDKVQKLLKQHENQIDSLVATKAKEIEEQ